MKLPFLALLPILISPAVLAQHEGHSPPETEPPSTTAASQGPSSSPATDPHAGHDMGDPAEIDTTSAEPGEPADPHAEHIMEAMPKASPDDPHAGHQMPGSSTPAVASDGTAIDNPPVLPPPAEAFSGPTHAADTLFDPAEMARMREEIRAENGEFITYWIMADQLESRWQEGGERAYLWDLQGWYGGDFNKLWLKSEGEGLEGESPEHAEVQALWSRAISPWWDLQLGLRHDFRPDPGRSHAVLGVQGLVPYQFEVDAATFLGEEGDLSFRLEAEYDQRITQRLILQPRIEVDLAANAVPEIGVGSGLSSAELGLRLRYEITREFAPYVGIEYGRRFGETAEFAELEGEEDDGWSFVVGFRLWY